LAFRGNPHRTYSVPPGLAGIVVTVRHRLGADTLQIISSWSGTRAAAARKRAHYSGPQPGNPTDSSLTMRGVRTLVLWDIDHTLIEMSGFSGEIYASVFLAVTGQPMERLADMSGRTDLAITVETLRLHGVAPTPETLQAFGSALAAGFSARREEIPAYGRVLAGARAALEALGTRPDVVQSVLTGNMEGIAVEKLTAFGLDRFVDFEAGAYGFDHTDRPPLVRLARERAARKYGEDFDQSTTVLIGDTPLDVEAGHRGGARVVAVATGSSDVEALRAAGAELVLTDLRETSDVVRAVLGVSAA